MGFKIDNKPKLMVLPKDDKVKLGFPATGPEDVDEVFLIPLEQITNLRSQPPSETHSHRDPIKIIHHVGRFEVVPGCPDEFPGFPRVLPTISGSSQNFPSVFQVFPRISKGFPGFPRSFQGPPRPFQVVPGCPPVTGQVACCFARKRL